MKNIIRITFYAAFCLTATTGYGQGWGETNKLEDTEIIVEKDRKIELPVASRNFEKVKVEALKPETQPVEYVLNDLKLANYPVPVQMRVLTIKQEDLPFLYGNHVRAGFGNYLTPYLHGYFHNTRNTNYSVGAEVRHISSARGPVEKDKSGMRNSGIMLNGEVYRNSLTFGANLGYDNELYHFYGKDRSELETLSAKDLEQKFNRISSRVFVNNANSQSKFKAGAGVGYNFISDNHKMSEGDIRTDANLGYSLSDKSAVKAELQGSFIKYKLADLSTDRSFVRVRPYYQANLGNLNVILGATFAYSNDTLFDAAKTNIYPHVQASYQVIEGKLTVFGGVTGDMERNTMHSLTKENPWLASNIETGSDLIPDLPNVILQNTSRQLDVFGGLRGSARPQVGYQLRIGYQRYKNLFFFNNSAADSARFSLFYDTEASSAVYTRAEVNYTASDRLRIGLKINYDSWNVSKVMQPGYEAVSDKPFHRPSLTSNLFATYNLSNKIFFTADFYYIGSTYAQNLISGQVKETDNVTDLSLKADYRFSDRFSAFLMFNNVLAKKYERYLYYPVQGIQALGGISYSF